MMISFKKAALGTALAATLATGLVAGAAPADARPYWGHGYYRGGGGVAVAAGLVGLAAGVAIASDHGPYGYPAPAGYYPAYPAYPAYNGCYSAYPGYPGYCYPASYYTNLGWGWHDGGWWYGGARYAHPFVMGGYRGGAGYYHGGYGGGYRGGYGGGGYHGGAGYHGGGAAHAGGGGHGGGGGGHR